MLLIFWWLRTELLCTAPGRWGTALLIGGDLGNLYDRLVHGGVIDFIDFRIWPVFNVADMCIDLGIALLLVHYLMTRNRSVDEPPETRTEKSVCTQKS